MSPFTIWVLYTYETSNGQTGCRTYGLQDQAAAQALGEQLQADKPAEVQSFGFMVLPLEGPPGTEPNTQ